MHIGHIVYTMYMHGLIICLDYLNIVIQLWSELDNKKPCHIRN